MTEGYPDPWADIKCLLPEPFFGTWIDMLIAQAQTSPDYQRERDWYQVHTTFDLDDILKSPEGRRAFWAGTMYAQCRQESAS